MEEERSRCSLQLNTVSMHDLSTMFTGILQCTWLSQRPTEDCISHHFFMQLTLSTHGLRLLAAIDALLYHVDSLGLSVCRLEHS